MGSDAIYLIFLLTFWMNSLYSVHEYYIRRTVDYNKKGIALFELAQVEVKELRK